MRVPASTIRGLSHERLRLPAGTLARDVGAYRCVVVYTTDIEVPYSLVRFPTTAGVGFALTAWTGATRYLIAPVGIYLPLHFVQYTGQKLAANTIFELWTTEENFDGSPWPSIRLTLSPFKQLNCCVTSCNTSRVATATPTYCAYPAFCPPLCLP